MRVAVDATPLGLTSGGLARYTSELVAALAAQFPEDEYRLVSEAGAANGLERRWWLWGVRREMERLGAEIFHGTNFAVPYLPSGPSVMSLHDLSPSMDRAWHHAADRVRRRTPLLIRLGIATMIVTDSEAVRRQAIEYFHALAEAGTDHAIFNTPIMHIPGAFDVWAEEIIPAVERMTPAGR